MRINHTFGKWSAITDCVTEEDYRNMNCRLSKGGIFFIEKYRKVLTIELGFDIIDISIKERHI